MAEDHQSSLGAKLPVTRLASVQTRLGEFSQLQSESGVAAVPVEETVLLSQSQSSGERQTLSGCPLGEGTCPMDHRYGAVERGTMKTVKATGDKGTLVRSFPFKGGQD